MRKTRDHFKKSRDTQGIPHARMGMIKDRNDKDLTEAEEIKKWWKEYTELYKKILMTQITMMVWSLTWLEPDILECEVKWALGSITMNKVSGGDGIPVELFQILKVDGVKVLHSAFRKLSSGNKTGNCQFSFQSQRRAMPKNVQTTTQLCSFHTLVQ